MKLVGEAPGLDDAVSLADLLAATAERIEHVIVDFGDDDTTAVGVGYAAWAAPGMVIVCVPDPAGTPDHSAEDACIEQVTATVTYIAAGVGFEVTATAPEGTWGRYALLCKG